MWWQILLAGVLLAVVALFVRWFYFYKRFFRTTEFLHVDVPEMMKRLEDGTIDDLLLAKYKERGTLFYYQLLKVLRERVAAATEEAEKAFLQKVLTLMEQPDDIDWQIRTRTKVDGFFNWLLWLVRLSKAEEETMLVVSVKRDFPSGSFEEIYLIKNLPESVVAELNGLERCREMVF